MVKDPIGVVIVDDHAMVTDGLVGLLESEPDIEVLGTAGLVAEAIVVVERTQPNVVVMDYHLPDGDGGSATRTIRSRWPSVKVLMLTGSGAGEALATAIEAGCSGFLVKSIRGVELADAIRSVDRGELVIHAEGLRSALPFVGCRRPAAYDLTPRELEVLALLANGTKVDAIAERLYLARNTVRSHVQNVLVKLGAHSQLAAVAMALREHLVELDEAP